MQVLEMQPYVVRVELSDHDRSILWNLAHDLEGDILCHTETSFLDELDRRRSELRALLPDVSDYLAEVSTHRGAKVIVFDVGSDTVAGVGPTPTRYHLSGDTANIYVADVFRDAFIAIGGWYGYGFASQQNGAIHNNVVPIREHAETAHHSGNAKYDLGLHVEDASFNLGPELDISCDFLTLHFFRNDKLVPTIVAFPDWSLISHKMQDILRGQWFVNFTNAAQGGDHNTFETEVSVLYGPEDDPWFRLNAAKLNLGAYEPARAQALYELVAHLSARQLHIPVAAGQFIVIDNRRVLHGRPPYSEADFPRYDGTDRWQRRLTVGNDCQRLMQFETSPRLVDPVRMFGRAAQSRV